MDVAGQVQRLIDAGVPSVVGMSRPDFAGLDADLTGRGVLCVSPSLVPPSRLAPLMRRQDRAGFVVEDMNDLDQFEPIEGVEVPDRALYLLLGVERGDEFRGVTPDAALAQIRGRGRSPLTISEGISWLLQQPEVLADNHCFMCVGSRRVKGTRVDARTPALWISRGGGRDGAARRNAPKVGWCWAGNHHSWLGSASAAGRRGR